MDIKVKEETEKIWIKEEVFDDSPNKVIKSENSEDSKNEDYIIFTSKKRKCEFVYENIRWYMCSKCPFKSKEKTDLEKHNCSEDTRWLECDQCSYKTKFRVHLETHKIHKHNHNNEAKIYSNKGFVNGKKWYTCPITNSNCFYRTQDKADLKKHVLTNHLFHTIPFDDFPQSNWHMCKYCRYGNRKRLELDVHMVLEHREHFKWFECDHCSFKTIYEEALSKHLSVQHSSLQKTKTSGEKWYMCSRCVFISKEKAELDAHEQNEHVKRIKRFKCDKCTYKTEYEAFLQNHILMKHLVDMGKCQTI